MKAKIVFFVLLVTLCSCGGKEQIKESPVWFTEKTQSETYHYCLFEAVYISDCPNMLVGKYVNWDGIMMADGVYINSLGYSYTAMQFPNSSEGTMHVTLGKMFLYDIPTSTMENLHAGQLVQFSGKITEVLIDKTLEELQISIHDTVIK